MDCIFHEKQEGALCAQHCMNSLLQGPYFNAVDLASIAKDLDEAERQRMAEGSTNSLEYMNFLQQPSCNMDDSGYFSIQVICKALEVWNLEMIPYSSQAAEQTRQNPYKEIAFICNQQNHWLTIRKLGQQWFNLNSVKAHPELISNTYLTLLLAQLQAEGYSIYIIKGKLPDCEAQQLFEMFPLSVPDYNQYIEEQRAKSKTRHAKSNSMDKTDSDRTDMDSIPDVMADPIAVRNKRLQYFNKNANSTELIEHKEMDEEEMLKRAIEMSLEPVE